jgi:hypothetical protein
MANKAPSKADVLQGTLDLMVLRTLESLGPHEVTGFICNRPRRARLSRKSSNFLWRIVGVVFMRVNVKCAHQARPHRARFWGIEV